MLQPPQWRGGGEITLLVTASEIAGVSFMHWTGEQGNLEEWQAKFMERLTFLQGQIILKSEVNEGHC